jgi:hypothetical protein
VLCCFIAEQESGERSIVGAVDVGEFPSVLLSEEQTIVTSFHHFENLDYGQDEYMFSLNPLCEVPAKFAPE